MKRLFTSAFILFLSVSLGSAMDAKMFDIDLSNYEEAFEELSNLESHVVENSYTLEDLTVQNEAILTNINLERNYSAKASLEGSESPLGIPSFVWGFCCWTAGIAVVYFTTEDSEETKKALWGCLAGSALYSVVWLVYYLVIFSYYSY